MKELASLNFVDVAIILVILFYSIEGFTIGFAASFLEFISFVISFAAGLKFYNFGGMLVSKIIQLPPGFSNTIGFFAITLFAEIILKTVFTKLYPHISHILQEKYFFLPYGLTNKILGLLTGALSGFVLLSFFLNLIISIPVSPYLSKSITTSRYGSFMISQTQQFDKNLKDIFGETFNETIHFLTVEPQSGESINLHFKTTNAKTDFKAEQYMLFLVNKERVTRGIAPLLFNEKLAQVGREHARDMLARGYFSHYTPEGLSPFNRMDQAHVVYTSAGENLAFAPTTDLAMDGLMKSPGHKANILSPFFGKVGIGVLDAGLYGEMFVQEFTN